MASYFAAANGTGTGTTSDSLTIPGSLPTTAVLVLAFVSVGHTSGDAHPTVSDNNGGAAWTQITIGTSRIRQFWWKRYEPGLSGKTISISGTIESVASRLVVYQDAYQDGDPVTNFVAESNVTSEEAHASMAPDHADSAVGFVVYNNTNDLTVSSITAATSGAPDHSGEALSTGGTDSGVATAVWNDHPASATGEITWAQSNGATNSLVYAIRPAVGGAAPRRAGLDGGMNGGMRS